MTMPRKLALGVASATALSFALAGCGSGADDSSAAEGGKDSLSWMAMLHTPTTPEPDGAIESKLQENTGVDIDFQWIPAASQEEKINSALASDSLADIVSLPDPSSSTTRSALKSGQFWDVEPYLKDYPNLAKIDEETLDGARIDGTLYGIPQQKIKARYGVLVRQDWLDKLGLEVPHTTEDLAEVAKAFATEDPDGNGKDDTTGIYDREESFLVGYRSLSGYFGAGNKFEFDEDGNVVTSFTTDAYKEAMEWYRDLYEAGGVNQEFVTVQKTDQQDGIAQGKGGIVVTGLFEAKNYTALAQSADPETPMKWALVNDMTHEGVERRIISDTNGGVGGWYSFSKSQLKTEDELKVALKFINDLMDEENFDLMTNGVEGTHYESDAEDNVTILDQPLWEQEVQPFSSSRPSEKVKKVKSDSPYANEADEKMAEQEEYMVPNVAQSLSSETFDSRYTEFEKTAMDAYNKYITGQIEMEDYEKTIETLEADGLDQIEQEFTESSKATQG